MSSSYAQSVSKATVETAKTGCIGDTGLRKGLNSSSDSALISSNPHKPQLTWEEFTETARLDERFNSFYKRLKVFQAENETDKAFAQRIGVSVDTFKGWKRGRVPSYLSTVEQLGRRLDVCVMWLWWGLGHKITLLPRGIRLTFIPKFQPNYVITDRPENGVQAVA